MVRAGVVKHPSEWPFGGYGEIQSPKRKNVLIDYDKLMDVLGLQSYYMVQQNHKLLVEDELISDGMQRQEKWSKSIAVGSREFVESVQGKLGGLANGRKVDEDDRGCQLREPAGFYDALFSHKNSNIGMNNAYNWDIC